MEDLKEVRPLVLRRPDAPEARSIRGETAAAVGGPGPALVADLPEYLASEVGQADPVPQGQAHMPAIRAGGDPVHLGPEVEGMEGLKRGVEDRHWPVRRTGDDHVSFRADGDMIRPVREDGLGEAFKLVHGWSLSDTVGLRSRQYRTILTIVGIIFVLVLLALVFSYLRRWIFRRTFGSSWNTRKFSVGSTV
jgi:hypothetical protein